MSVELRPLGVACNLACDYCYQNPQRDAGNQRMTYDLEKMKQEAARIGGPFTLFGGEPLLMRFADLEDLFAWGLEKFGGNAIQTNGILIEDRHIELFRRYKVTVGISIDGPGELNSARSHRGGVDRTRRATAAVEAAIERLCQQYQAPGLIITLHKGNATADKLPSMAQWLHRLHSIGIRSVRLHLLEVDHQVVRDRLALTPQENIQALLAFAAAQETLPGMRFDLFEEIEALLGGRDAHVGCIWRACDPYTTEAVQGVEGNGQSSNCGRTNKDGVGFIKAEPAGYERYLALYATAQADNGCADCRFFLMCKGQCPGTALGGDWRNRTEHCHEWKSLFQLIERRMIIDGRVPLTIQPVRFEIERRQIEAWRAGHNPSISQLASEWRADLGKQSNTAAREAAADAAAVPSLTTPRISWVSQRAREIWQQRLERLPAVIEELRARVPVPLPECCARAAHGDSRPGELFPTHPDSFDIPNSVAAHPLLAPLGISLWSVMPCRLDCAEADRVAQDWLQAATGHGYDTEIDWLREILSWPVLWTQLHGVVEVKTPLFKMCFRTEFDTRARTIRREGGTRPVEGSVSGLRFPYALTARMPRSPRRGVPA